MTSFVWTNWNSSGRRTPSDGKEHSLTTSTAEQHGYRYPQCGDPRTEDTQGRGFVRHTTNRKCQFEKGQKDE